MNRIIAKGRLCFSKQKPQSFKLQDAQRMLEKHDFVGLKRLMIDGSGREHKAFRRIMKLRQSKANIRWCAKLQNYEGAQYTFGLNYLGTVQSKLQKPLVSLDQYKLLLHKYYSDMDEGKINFQNFACRFAYLDNKQIVNYIKQNQLKVVENQTNKIEAHKFEDLINVQLFNITDLPMILELLYEIHFPSLQKIKDLKQITSSLIYLSYFSKIPFFFPKQLLQTLEQYIYMHPTMNFRQFQEISNVIFLITYHFGGSLNQLGLVNAYEKLYRELLNKLIQSERRNDQQSIRQLVQSLYQQQKLKVFDQRKNHIKVIDQQVKTMIDNKVIKIEEKFAVDGVLIKDQKSIQQLLANNAEILRKKTEFEYQIKEFKTMLLTASNTFFETSILEGYIKKAETYNFLKENYLIPQLYQYLAVTHKRIGQKITQARKKDKKQLVSLQKQINQKINQTVKEVTIKIQDNLSRSDKNYVKWSLIYEPLFQKLLSSDDQLIKILDLKPYYGKSVSNVLYLLKNDPEYMLSLLQWNTHKYLTKNYIPNYLESKDIELKQNEYTDGIGFRISHTSSKLTEGAKESTLFKYNTELLKNINQAHHVTPFSSDKPHYLKGNLRNMISTLRQIIIKSKN